MENKSGTGNGLVKILAIFLFVFLGNAAAGTVIIQDGQVGTSNGTSPLRPAHIAATQDANLRLQDTSGSGPAAYIEFYNDTTRWGYIGLAGHDDKLTIATAINKNLSFYTNDQPRMTLTAEGKFGIGTTSPTENLTVAGGGKIAAYRSTNDRRGLFYTNGNGTWLESDVAGGDPLFFLSPGGPIVFRNSTSENMRILANGNVGIGTTNPHEAVEINGQALIRSTTAKPFSGLFDGTMVVAAGLVEDAIIAKTDSSETSAAAGIFHQSSTAPAFDAFRIQSVANSTTQAVLNVLSGVNDTTGTGGSSRLFVRGDGKVGIGTTTPHGMLEVRSSSNAEIVLNRAGAWATVPEGIKFATDDAVTSNWTFGMLADSTNNIYLKRNAETLMTFNYSSSNVGIGTASLATGMRLHVAGTGYFEDNVTIGTGTAASAIRIRDRGANWLSIESTGPNAYRMDMAGTTAIGTLNFNDFNVSVTGGNVGIGTASPTQKLDVAGEVNAYSFTVNGSPVTGGGSQWTTAGANIYNATANVGIGTASPAALLHIQAPNSSALSVYANITTITYTADLTSGGTPISSTTAGGTLSYVFDGTVDPLQNVYIAKPLPGTAYVGYDFGAGNPKQIQRIRYNQDYYGSNAYAITSAVIQRSDDCSAWTNVTTVNNLIGGNSANYFNDINFTNSVSARCWRLLANSNNGGGGVPDVWIVVEIEMMEVTSTTYAMIPQLVVKNNRTGFGIENPQARLHVLGNNVNTDWGIEIQESVGNTYRQIYMKSGALYFWNGANEAYLTSAGAWTAASDASYKKDVKNISYGLDDLLKMQPRSYNMKSDNSPQVGFVAQELEKVIPEVVSGEEGRKGVAYGQLSAVIVKAVQEQQAQIDKLKEENDALKQLVCADHPQAEACR